MNGWFYFQIYFSCMLFSSTETEMETEEKEEARIRISTTVWQNELNRNKPSHSELNCSEYKWIVGLVLIVNSWLCGRVAERLARSWMRKPTVQDGCRVSGKMKWEIASGRNWLLRWQSIIITRRSYSENKINLLQTDARNKRKWQKKKHRSKKIME